LHASKHQRLTIIWGADEVGLLPERELGDTLVPALDDAADALNEQVSSYPGDSQPLVERGETLDCGVA
jgi:hypothetical protein